MLSIDDACKKYQAYIDAIAELERNLVACGIVLRKYDEFELGARWQMHYDGRDIGSLLWNIPHYLRYQPAGHGVGDGFALDYVKNSKDWALFLDDVYLSARAHVTR